MASKIDDRKWEVLEQEYLFREPWLTVRRDKVKLPTGAVIPDYYLLEYPAWANVIAVTKDGRFVTVRQYRHGLGETRFELCAGVCEEGEEPLESARRELLEETGYAGGEWKLFSVLSANAGTTTNLTYCYLAEGVGQVSQPHPETTEDLSVHLFSKEEMYRMLSGGEFRQSLMAAPLWKYFATAGR